MSNGRVIIIGAGQGGLQAAMSLRQEGHAGSITLIGAEPGLPYQRPPLSKAYLKTGDAGPLTLRPELFFEKKDIALVPGTTVDRIDRQTRRVYAGTRHWDYDHLILATGTHNFRPPIPGIERALNLRTLLDAEGLRSALDRKLKIAVIGGGFIGLEFSAVALGLGHDVTVAEAAPRLMARAVSPEMSQLFFDKHAELGTKVLLNAAVAAVEDRGIKLADGTFIEADLTLLAAGVRPNSMLASEAGLETENGVVVDAGLRTSDPAIFAIGDCAAFPYPGTDGLVRLESVQAATDHARLVAKQIVGRSKLTYNAVAWFWSDQADWKLQIAGLAAPSDRSVVRDATRVFRFRDDILTAIETINDAKTHMQARKCLSAHPGPTRAMLEAVGYDLTALTVGTPA
ncbi:NAD(P)/FAD-dependent oxidoreductase [Nioella aestuarii]|uniref:NAD(P)/FAD-dependent oxidoreductase n=1 Tax=Nioella aestuarii TaxID=1662864 RepID=UPI003D7FCF28